jgi:transposase
LLDLSDKKSWLIVPTTGENMARITRAAPRLSAEEVKMRLKQDSRPWCRQRWLIIYNALVDPRGATDIAKHTGTTVAMVHQVISAYNRLGEASVETPGKGGRRHQYVTFEEEQAFLAPFFSHAQRGEIATAGEIKRAFEAQVGHTVHKSTISRLLKRHGWRKPMPRPVHPKADPAAQEQFKKTLQPA